MFILDMEEGLVTNLHDSKGPHNIKDELSTSLNTGVVDVSQWLPCQLIYEVYDKSRLS